MTHSVKKASIMALLSFILAGCDSSENASGKTVQPPLLQAGHTTTSSITLQELDEGVCDQVLFENRNPGYTGAGYINTPNSIAARVSWRVYSENGGQYSLSLHYANGSDTARSGILSVQQTSTHQTPVPLPPTGGWQQWANVSLPVMLEAGENTLTLKATSDSGLANIDSLSIEGQSVAAGKCPETDPTAHRPAPTDYNYLAKAPIGWVNEEGGVSGGGQLNPVVVSNMDDLRQLASDPEPRVIHVEGRLTGTLSVGSNKTIVGRHGAQISSASTALKLENAQNVIIQNLILKGTHSHNKPNTIIHNSKNIWMDHNTFIDGSPDLLLVSGTSDFITVSWNLFQHSRHGHEHMGVNIGASDQDLSSRGHLRVTLHHNLYASMINERMPRVRFGQVHSFNNLMIADDDPLTRSYYALRAGVDANIRSERNVFKNFNGPSWWWTSEKLGAKTATVFNYARGNDYSILESIDDICIPECVLGPIDIKEHGGVTGKAGFYSKGEAFIPPYLYSLEETKGLEKRIIDQVGAR